jgi:hypothetical protein
MAYNGSGTFVRVHDWEDDKANTIPVTASRMDAEDDGFATGLSTAITKDGQTTITADLPMSGFNHTGVGDSNARDEYLATGQYQDQSTIYATTTGSANAYVLTLSPAITAYAAGQSFEILASFGNTGAATLNVSGLGTKAITKDGTTALASGDIVSGAIYRVTYDGTQFQLTTVATPFDLDLGGTLDVTGATTLDSTLDVAGATDFAGVITGGQTDYNVQTGTTYTLTASDEGKVVTLNNASAITLTLPENSTEALPEGFSCILRQLGAGQVTVAVEGSDTLQSKSAATKLVGQYSEAQVDIQTAGTPNTWFMAGDTTA